MTNAQLSPRQKMINMLYLVLTAILALNVSSEVLDAFKTVNDGIDDSNFSLQSKNSGFYSEFADQFQNDSARVDTIYRKAKKARELSAKFTAKLEQYKKQMIAEAGGIDPETGKIKRDDDIDISTRLFVENNGRNGKELKQHIETTRVELLNLLEENDRKEAEQYLSLGIDEAKNGKPWEVANFNQVPVVAAVTLLSKYQNDMLSAEGHVVEKLYNSVYAKTEKVDKLAAKIISPSAFILQGEAYKADVMVAAYSSTQNPDVFLGQFTSAVKRDANGNLSELVSASEAPPLTNPVKVVVDGGLGKISLANNASGNKKYSGVVRVKSNATGEYRFFPFEGEYQVAPKVAVVSPTKMNVLYVGLDNPVDISVPGVAQNDIVASFEGDGTLLKNPDGSYYAQVKNPGTTKVKVSARVGNKLLPIGEQKFRIKNIPNPSTTVDGISQGGTAAGKFVEDRIGVVPKQDDFVYGTLPWKVQSFVVSIRRGADLYKEPNQGAVFNKKIKDLMKGIKKGDAVFVEQIKVLGPDNKVREISPLAFNITTR